MEGPLEKKSLTSVVSEHEQNAMVFEQNKIPPVFPKSFSFRFIFPGEPLFS